jgi:hypothetical protein
VICRTAIAAIQRSLPRAAATPLRAVQVVVEAAAAGPIDRDAFRREFSFMYRYILRESDHSLTRSP